MAVPRTVRAHIDGASYLYGFAGGVRDGVAVTWFLIKRALAQLETKATPQARIQEDASIYLYDAWHVVDLLGSEIFLLDEIYRDHLYDRVPGFVPRMGETVVDVGANVGIFTILQARRGARVYAFEPNPECFRRLAKAVVKNELTQRVNTFNLAIGRDAGTGVMHVPAWHSALGSVQAAGTETASTSPSVLITSLDLILPALDVGHVHLLKIDTEGAEVDVLCGAEHLLASTDRIILEYHSAEYREQVRDLLALHGFQQVLHVDTPAFFLPDAGMIYAEKSHLRSQPRSCASGR